MSSSLARLIAPVIRGEAQLTVTTAGTPVKPAALTSPADQKAKYLRIINNNAVAIVAVGLFATVDALSTPKIGVVLYENDSVIVPVRHDPAELIGVDADINSTVVTVQQLGE